MPPESDIAYTVTYLLGEISQQDYPVSALYVIATPIGNIADISLRALHVLSMVDAIACEDTRNTRQLLSRYGLTKPLLAVHQHNEREMAEQLIARMRSGERIALVSDAGTPAISDPGARIVDAVRTANFRIVPLPGSSAPIAALSVSGLVQDRFLFVGFLPSSATQRSNALMALRDLSATLIFLEAPHRVLETAKTFSEVFEPDRQIVVARELTKLFEEVHRCRVSEVHDWLSANPNRIKGEFVLLLEGAPSHTENNDAEAKRVLDILLSELPVSQAAALTAKITGQKKNALYQLALEMTGHNTKR